MDEYHEIQKYSSALDNHYTILIELLGRNYSSWKCMDDISKVFDERSLPTSKLH